MELKNQEAKKRAWIFLAKKREKNNQRGGADLHVMSILLVLPKEVR